MASESQPSDTIANRIKAIMYLIGGMLVLFLMLILLYVHGDGYVEPAIRVQVRGIDGLPVDDATLIFSPVNSTREDSIGTTDGHGRAEVQGSFGAAFFLHSTQVSGRGILRVEKPGYLPVEVLIDGKKRRREILDELIELDIALKQEKS